MKCQCIIISILFINTISYRPSKISLIQQNAYLEMERLKNQHQKGINAKIEDLSKECDIITDGPICLFNGDRILLPNAKPEGLIGHWSFDEILPLDQSSNQNHAVGTLTAGPSFGGYGSAALFYNANYLQVPHSNTMSSHHFAFTFWLFIVEDYFTANKGGRYCPFIQKGTDNPKSKLYQRSPAIIYDRQEKFLEIYLSTSSKEDSSNEGEHFFSRVKILPQRWVHIAVTTKDNSVNLYINGIFDKSLTLKGTPEDINSPLYIGNVPWLKGECNFPFIIDELRYYNKDLPKDHIQAEAAPVLGGIDPNFLEIGCLECTLDAAASACNEGYRLCSSIELHTGGYQIARSLGLLSWDTHIWTNSALSNKAQYASLLGLGLCCAILK